MTATRRALFVLALAGRRLTRRAGRAALVAGGIAGGAAVLAAVSVGSLVAQDRSMDRAVAHLASPERVVRVSWFGVPVGDERFRTLDETARRTLADVGVVKPRSALLYRETRVGGALVDLGSVDGLRSVVRLQSGRFPRPCTAMRCEVVQVGGTGRIPSARGLRLVPVGRGALVSPVPFGRTSAFGRSVEDTHGFSGATQAPFVLAEGVPAAASLPTFATIYRSYAWISPLGRGAVHPWTSAAFTDRIQRARSALETRSPLFDVAAPIDAVAAAGRTARAAGRRLLVVGGEAAALLLAFVALAAASLRRDSDATRRRLVRFGSRPWQTALLATAEAGALAAASTALGWAIGTAVGALVADRADSPAGTVLRHSAASGGGLGIAAGLGLAAALVLVVALYVPPVRLGGWSLTAVDVLALAAVAAVALALARGDASAGVLARDRGTGTLLLLLPGLVCFAAAVLLARLLGPALRLAERSLRSGPVPARLAALSLARAPGRAAAAAAFLAVSIGLAVFALAYRATLTAAATEQAAYAVPADFVLREDLGRLVSPLALPPPRAARSEPILRLSGDSGTTSVTVLGVPGRALPETRGWRRDFASRPLSELAQAVTPRTAVTLRGPTLPADARRLVLPVTGSGDVVIATASVATSRGGFDQVVLGETPRSGRRLLTVPLPPSARGGRLLGLTLGLTTPDAHNGTPARGTLALEPMAVETDAGRSVVEPDYSSWRGDDGVSLHPAAGGLLLRYLVTTANAPRFRIRQATDGRPVSVVASSSLARTAGPGGLLPVRLAGGQQLLVHVVATASRFPSTYGAFVLGDEGTITTALNAVNPGSAVPAELWTNAATGRRDAVAAELRRAPYDVLAVRDQQVLARALRTDPLARAVLAALGTAAVLGAVLALLGIVLTMVSDLRDERGDLFDLEAQGSGPSLLRAYLRLRAVTFGAAGLAAGLALGAGLAALVVGVVTLTASGGSPQPPLALELDWPLLSLGLAGFGLAAALLVEAAVRRSFAGPVPPRGSELA